jgi:hypothetical protein
VSTTNNDPTGNNVAGIALRSLGVGLFSRDGGRSAEFNRKTSDGEIVAFRKDGTVVGTIGTVSSALYIGSPEGTDSFIKFTGNRVQPSTSTGANRDAAIDLGATGNRFKDLYLSGGVYLGGTGSANLLDDYEEGTWTPNVTFAGGTTGITYAGRAGFYRKIGNTVFIAFWFEFTNKGSSSGAMQVNNIPFSTQSSFIRFRINVGYFNVNAAPRDVQLGNATNTMTFKKGSETDNFNDTDATNTSQIYVSGFYFT